jgi:hypothetical protein
MLIDKSTLSRHKVGMHSKRRLWLEVDQNISKNPTPTHALFNNPFMVNETFIFFFTSYACDNYWLKLKF